MRFCQQRIRLGSGSREHPGRRDRLRQQLDQNRGLRAGLPVTGHKLSIIQSYQLTALLSYQYAFIFSSAETITDVEFAIYSARIQRMIDFPQSAIDPAILNRRRFLTGSGCKGRTLIWDR